jgi:hypothetical protein
MSMTASDIEEHIKLLSLEGKMALLKTLLREIESHQPSGTILDVRTILTLEALEDIEAGRLIDHADVKAWAESLGTANPLPLPK